MTKSLRKSIHRCVLTAATLAALLVIFPTATLADDAEEGAEPAIPTATLAAGPEEGAESEDSSGIEVIYVTSQRRREAVQTVPLSVTALSGETLSNAGVLDVSRLKLLTPGLNFGQTGANTHLAIRGARTEGILTNVQPIISFYNDGVYRSGTLQMTAPLIDVERIEILRGPQGTLFGRNAYGGAINVISKKPEQEFDFGMTGTFGDYARRDFQGFVNIPINDTMAVRLVGSKRDHDGYVENFFNRNEDIKDQDDFYIGGSALWEPTERISVIVRGSIWNQEGNGSADFNYFSPGTPKGDSALGVAVPINVLNGSAPPSLQDETPYKFARDVDFILDAEQRTISAQLDWDLDFANLMVLGAYTEYENFHTNDIDMSSVDTGFEGQFDDLATSQIELHLSGDLPWLEWLAGGNYIRERNRDSFFIETNGVGVDGFAFYFANKRQIEIDAWALFAQATAHVPLTNDRLRLTAGLRYSYEKQRQDLVDIFDCCSRPDGLGGVDFLGKPLTAVPDFRATMFDPNAGALAQARADCLADPINCGFDIYTDYANLSATYDPVTYRVALDFDVLENSMAYFSASSGYASGGFNQSANQVTGTFSFDEQKVTAYEFGVKNTFFNRAMTLNVALFYNDFHQILSEPNAFVGGANIIYNEIGGDGDALGIDVEFDWIPLEDMLINLRFEWLDAEYGTFKTGVGGTLSTGNSTRPQFGCTEIVPGDGTCDLPFMDVSGRRMAFSPEFTLGISAEYRFELEKLGLGLGRYGSLTPGIQFYYSSAYQTADQHFSFSEQPSYTQTDMRLTWLSENEHYTASVFVQNIENEAVLLRTNIFTGKQIGQTFADPRIFGFTFGYRFQ